VRRLAIWAAFAFLFPAFVFLIPVGCDRGDHPGRIDKPAPQFAVNDGVTAVDLSRLRGRVVVLNLWATWCPPCLEELPSLLEMQRELPQVTVVAVSMDEDDAIYRKFLVTHRVDLITVRDPSRRVNALYGTVQIPETYVIDRQGVLRRKFVSAQDWTNPEILKYLRSL
jgi:cytochrome c biogenesis protein CcmG, thiol:disulfide interchange protein DsbE